MLLDFHEYTSKNQNQNPKPECFSVEGNRKGFEKQLIHFPKVYLIPFEMYLE